MKSEVKNMARLECSFYSGVLGMRTNFIMYLPEKREEGTKVLYLLHGLSDTFRTWDEYSAIGRYVRDKNIAVIMPDAQKSFYTDMKYGLPFYTYLSGELPGFIKEQFNLEQKRENTHIAGLSMGGYGALKIGLNNPHNFKSIGAFSAVCDIVELVNERKDDFAPVFGYEDIKDTMHDLFYVVKNLGDVKPSVYHWCGTEDFLYEQNIKFSRVAKEFLPCYTYSEGPGDHSWQYWDKEIVNYLKNYVLGY